MWHTILQPASYKDAGFEIENMDERNGKALAEHARPFVNGIDLEDMGTTGREVQLSAVFWGKGYAGRLKKLLDKLEERGGGVLVHPVWGRMQNLIASSWSYRHEADYADFSRLDVTFREATEAQPIFVFENHFLMDLERIIEQIDTYRAAGEGFIDALTAVMAQGQALRGSAAGLWSVAAGVFEAVRSLFDLDDVRFTSRGGYSQKAFSAGFPRLFDDLGEMARTGLRQSAYLDRDDKGGAGVRQCYDAAAAKADAVSGLVADMGKGRLKDGVKRQVETVGLMVRLITDVALTEVAADLVGANSETMTAPELMHINRDMRLRFQTTLEGLRQTDGAGMEDAVYEAEEAVRQTASRLNALVAAAINQKPPLLVRAAPIDGTVHQIAHEFYGDLNRAEELVRLNPHIIHPAFVKRGTWVNLYAK